MNQVTGTKTAQAILRTVTQYTSKTNQQMTVSHMVHQLAQEGQNGLGYYIARVAYEEGILMGYKYIDLVKLVGKHEEAMYWDRARQNNLTDINGNYAS